MRHFLVYFLISLIGLDLGACKTTINRDNSSFSQKLAVPLNHAAAPIDPTTLRYVSFTDPTLFKRITRFGRIKNPALGLSAALDVAESLEMIGALVVVGGGVGIIGHHGLSNKIGKGEIGKNPLEPLHQPDKVTVDHKKSPPSSAEGLSSSPSSKQTSDEVTIKSSLDSPLEHTSPLMVPEQLGHLRLIEDLTNPEDFRFKKDEDAVLLVIDLPHPLINKIKGNQDGRIIHGTTEYRVVSEKNNVALVNAFDLRPQLKTKDVLDKINKRDPYLPEATFRADPDFEVKRDIAANLAHVLRNGPLTLGEQGRFTLSNGMFIDFEVARKLGNGSFGEVFLLKFKDPLVGDGKKGKEFSLAVKQPVSENFGKDFPDYLQEEMVREIDYLQAMARHPNGMQFYGAFPADKKGRYSQVLEVLDGDWSAATHLSDDAINRVMVSAADGYVAMHASNLVHNDTKPGNLFFQGNHAKLGDFGKSVKVQPGIFDQAVSEGTFQSISIKSIDLTQASIKGDPFKVDVFALGLSLIDLRVKGKTWEKIVQCCKQDADFPWGKWFVLDGDKFFKFIEFDLSTNGAKPTELALFQRMVSNDPQSRPTMEEVATELRTIHQLDDM